MSILPEAGPTGMFKMLHAKRSSAELAELIPSVSQIMRHKQNILNR